MPSLTPDEIVAAHELFGSAATVVERRRALYQAAVELTADADLAAVVSVDVLDDPVVRGHIGACLSGVAKFERHRLVPTEASQLGSIVGHPRVASSRSAERALGPALARIAGSVSPGEGTQTLVTDGHARFDGALDTITQGIALASTCAPGLIADLLPHVNLLAVVDGRSSASLGSASVAEYPGLIVVPEPRSPIELAEALVHEGAHQKFFDLCMTASMMDATRQDQPRFLSSWASAASTPWPLGQCMAAFHAYTLLAAFARCVSWLDVRLHDYSLLPHAAARAAEIAQWLGQQTQWLSRDGCLLLDALSNEVVAPIGEDVKAPEPILAATDRVVERQCGPWTLVMRAADPVDIWWVRKVPSPQVG